MAISKTRNLRALENQPLSQHNLSEETLYSGRELLVFFFFSPLFFGGPPTPILNKSLGLLFFFMNAWP